MNKKLKKMLFIKEDAKKEDLIIPIALVTGLMFPLTVLNGVEAMKNFSHEKNKEVETCRIKSIIPSDDPNKFSYICQEYKSKKKIIIEATDNNMYLYKKYKFTKDGTMMTWADNTSN